MLTNAVIAALIAAAGATSFGVYQVIVDNAEHVAASSTIQSVLSDAQMLEILGSTRNQALTQAVTETPNAEGMTVTGESIQYQVGNTCLAGSFGPEYKYLIGPCK